MLNKHQNMIGILQILTSSIFIGAMPSFFRIDLPSVNMMVYVNIISLLIMGIIVFLFHPCNIDTLRDVKKMGWYSLVNLVMSLCWFELFKILTFSDAVILTKSSIFWIFIFSVVYGKERIKLNNLLFSFVVILGIYISVGGWNSGDFKGILLGLLVGISSAYLNVWIKHNLQEYSTFSITFWRILGVTILSLPLLLLPGNHSLPFSLLPTLAMVGFITQILLTYLITDGIRNLDQLQILGILAVLDVPVSNIVGYIGFGEIPTIHNLIGSGIVIVVYLLSVKKGYKE